MKRHIVAIVVVTVAVVLVSLLSLRVTLGRKARAVNEAYTQSVENGPKGPGAYLDAVDQCALSLIRIGERYPAAAAETEALRAVRADRAENTGPAADRAGLARYTVAAEDLTRVLETQPLTDLEQRELSKYALQLKDGATKAQVVAADYNEKAEAYDRLLHAFPVNLLYRLLGLKEAELFQ